MKVDPAAKTPQHRCAQLPFVLRCNRGNSPGYACSSLGGINVELTDGGLARLLTKDPTKGRVEVITKDGKRYFH